MEPEWSRNGTRMGAEIHQKLEKGAEGDLSSDIPQQKVGTKMTWPSFGEPPGAHMGATCHPKRSKDTFSSILDRFLRDVGLDFLGFHTMFQ